MTSRFVRTCTSCGNVSEDVYRCDDSDCSSDLVGAPTHVRHHEWPSIAGVRDDGLVEVEFEFTCLECGATRDIPLSYGAVGRVIRIGCPHCETVTKHLPSETDARRQARALGFDDQDRPMNTMEAAPAP